MHRAGCTGSTLYALYTGHAVHRGHNTRRTRCPLYTLRTAHTGSAARCTQCTLCTLHPVNAVPCTRSTPVRLGPLKDDLWIWKPRKPPFGLPSKRRPLGGREKTWKTTFQKKDDLCWRNCSRGVLVSCLRVAFYTTLTSHLLKWRVGGLLTVLVFLSNLVY